MLAEQELELFYEYARILNETLAALLGTYWVCYTFEIYAMAPV